jgi:hypothetical protein
LHYKIIIYYIIIILISDICDLNNKELTKQELKLIATYAGENQTKFFRIITNFRYIGMIQIHKCRVQNCIFVQYGRNLCILQPALIQIQ